MTGFDAHDDELACEMYGAKGWSAFAITPDLASSDWVLGVSMHMI